MPRALAVLRLISSSNLAGCRTGKSERFLTFENSPCINTQLAIHVRDTRPIAHQTARNGGPLRGLRRWPGSGFAGGLGASEVLRIPGWRLMIAAYDELGRTDQIELAIVRVNLKPSFSTPRSMGRASPPIVLPGRAVRDALSVLPATA